MQLSRSNGGTIEPALTFLFKGGLIFESLLKHLYPNKDDGRPCETLGHIYHTSSFRADFIPNVQTRAASLQNIVDAIGNNNDMQTAFNTASRLRNTTGHNLVWGDVFDDTDNFKALYHQLVNAIFYIIKVKFI